MNLARVPGQVIIGHASDTMGVRKLIVLMSLASTASVFAGWGNATNTAGVLCFALAFGVFAGSSVVLVFRCTMLIKVAIPLCSRGETSITLVEIR